MSNPRGVQEVYFTRDLPKRSVPIAHVTASSASPAELVDINNNVLNRGTLGVWKSTTLLTDPADFVSPEYGYSISINGSTQYFLDNQFFEITSVVSDLSEPLYYKHSLPTGVTDVVIVDLSNKKVDSTKSKVISSVLYHSMDGQPYRIRYMYGTEIVTEMLHYVPVMSEVLFAPTISNTYQFFLRQLSVTTSGTLHIRFLHGNGLEVLAPYDSLPNTPWYVRVRFGLQPTPPEWALQIFLPFRPYALGTWVPAKVLDKTMIEFERKRILQDAHSLPDILIFDKNHVLKYALEGTDLGTTKRGFLYPWRRGLVKSSNMDPYFARLDLGVDLAPDDIVFGFYSYKEPDIIYRDIDVNPFTNPDVKNKIIEFYYKVDSSVPLQRIFYRVKDPLTGTYISTLTNDSHPVTTGTLFGTVVVGASVNPKQYQIEDTRTRGGGLAKEWQDIPENVNFWDIGYWDGKPYPIGGAMIVYLPATLLNTMTNDSVENRVKSCLPMGTIPVIRYYQMDEVTGIIYEGLEQPLGE
jgi:hypothetical protein